MSTILIIILALVGLVLVAGLIFYLAVRRDPQRMEPVARFLMRFGPIRRRIEAEATEQLSADPDQLIEAARQFGGRDMARALEQQLAGKSEAERQAMIEQAMQMAESGKTPPVGQALAGKPPTSSAKRNKARAKRKAAKKQRRRGR